MTTESAPPEDLAAVRQCEASYRGILGELSNVIVGQQPVIEQVLIAVFAGGHALLKGVPGLAKTLLASSLAEATDLSFKRVQMTPDLMPADLSGTESIREDVRTGQRQSELVTGPVFANMILADELDRAPPKTQAALLEAMQQGQVTVGGTVHRLPEPFFVLATQDPCEQEETRPLPRGQLDRFLLYLEIDYPPQAEEWEIVRRVTAGRQGQVAAVTSGEAIRGFRDLVARVPVSDRVLGYASALVRASRPGKKESADFVDRWVAWGASPRGLLALVACAKARAILHGRYDATVEDVQAVAKPALRHRIVGNRAAEANALAGDGLVEMLMEAVPGDREYEKPEMESCGRASFSFPGETKI